MKGYENVGREIEEIRSDPELKKLEKFEEVNWTLVENHRKEFGGDWWVNE